MATLEELQAQRTRILAEIKRRGGEAKAPGFAKQLAETEQQIRSMRGSTPAQAPGATPTFPDQINTVNEGMQADIKAADLTANKQTQLNNPNVTNPFGSQTVTRDDQGNVTLNQTLHPKQQRVVDAGTRLSEQGLNTAINRLSSNGMSENWNPNLTPRQDADQYGTLKNNFNPNLTQRTLSGDLVADRARIEDQVFANLTRNLERDRSRDRNELEQSLANRGIPIDPNDPQYQRAMQSLDERYDARADQARAQAVTMGGDEYGRSVDIQEGMRTNDFNLQSGTENINTGKVRDRFNLGETLRANDLNEQGTIRSQNFNETMGTSTLGPGARIPEFQPYTPGQWQVNTPTQVATGLAATNQGQQALNLQKQQLQQQAAQAAAANRAIQRIGQTSGGTPTVPPFPVV